MPQYKIFKIGTDKLKFYNWNLNITKAEAVQVKEIVDLFEGTEFRLIADILDKKPSEIDYSEYILAVEINQKTHFSRAVSKKGIKINGNTFRRYVGTTGGLKNNTILFVNIEVLDELNRRNNCGRNESVPLVPAKYEAYKALSCSASQPIVDPRRILVVRDCITHFKDSVIRIDDSDTSLPEPVMTLLNDVELENTASDGFNLCTIEYMRKVSESLGLDYITSGVCLRNAWLKGMLYPFPIIEFVEKYNNGNYMIEDIWGDIQDIRECDMILTESSLKLWNCYDSIDHYMKCYKENGYTFSVTKISPHVLDDVREVNYQYLQSYDFTDEDIEELCAPTVEWLKNAFCGDYESTVKFLGLNESTEKGTWQYALYKCPEFLGDKNTINNVNRMIRKKINDAKIGKLLVNGNYQIASGDPFALMQSICDLEVTGLLKADECYSKYWEDREVDEVVIFRSPMTSHNNIRKCRVASNEDIDYWYQYMDTIMIINDWDSFCMAENGCDYDSDILYSTDNPVLIRKHRRLPAIQCMQQSTPKVVITEKDVVKTNKDALGNQVGTITNRVTAMMEVQSHFKPESKEYKELEYRIACGQHYQQVELDRIKGIVARPMPAYWYNIKACGDDKYLQSICCHKKPYFMKYIYNAYNFQEKKTYKEYDTVIMQEYRMHLQDLIDLKTKTPEQKEKIEWYYRDSQMGQGNCAMNRICRYMEQQLDGLKTQLKENSAFDYNFLKVKRRCTKEHIEGLKNVMKQYSAWYSDFVKKGSSTRVNSHNHALERRQIFKVKKEFYQNLCETICPNADERTNIILDISYNQNNSFCWAMIGNVLSERIEQLNDNF